MLRLALLALVGCAQRTSLVIANHSTASPPKCPAFDPPPPRGVVTPCGVTIVRIDETYTFAGTLNYWYATLEPDTRDPSIAQRVASGSSTLAAAIDVYTAQVRAANLVVDRGIGDDALMCYETGYLVVDVRPPDSWQRLYYDLGARSLYVIHVASFGLACR
jgi:hypothetical protein